MKVPRWPATAVAVGASIAALSGCGSHPPAAPTTSSSSAESPSPPAYERNLVPEAYEGHYRTAASVLESPQHGPQLCYWMNESLPPTCGGPDVLGWDWAAVPAGSAESVNGTTWGAYELVGTFTDEAFMLTEPAAAPGAGADQGDASRAEDDRFATPCPEPAGGWAPIDPTRATEQAAEEAQEVAAATPGFALLWIDQQVPDAEITEENSNDPQRYVLNVATTDDTAALEIALRRVWGGSLCVSNAPRTEADLDAIQAALPEVPGLPAWFTSSSDPIDGVVDISVPHGTQEQQRALDERFGAGAVRLSSQLEPIG